MLTLAEKENKSNIRNMCDLLFGIVDVFSFVLVVLPLYPNPIDGYIFSVNLLAYTDTTTFNRLIYWLLFIALIVVGVVKILLTHFKIEKGQKIITGSSLGLSILAVLFLAMTREAYAITVAFLLLVIKGVLLFKYIKTGN